MSTEHGEPPEFVKWLIWLFRKETWINQPFMATLATVIVSTVAVAAIYKLIPERNDYFTTTYGVSQKLVDDLKKNFKIDAELIEYFLNVIKEKDVTLKDRNSKLKEMIQKYQELEERLAKRSAEDHFVARAKERLDAGDLDGAEKLLLQSYEKNLQAIAEKKKAAASDAFELASLKELRLDYYSAKDNYEQAVQIEPDNTEYLNKFGLILHKLGEYQNAIINYEKALSIDLQAYGDQHPNVAIQYNNLGLTWGSLLQAITGYTKEDR